MPNELDPQARELLEVVEASGAPPLHLLGVEGARERMRAAFVTRGDPVPVADVDETEIPTPGSPLRVRTYRPTPGDQPAALFLHGGGWTLNDLDTHDELCRRLAVQSGYAISALDYRRAPEHQYPAALIDTYITFRWLADHAARTSADRPAPAVIGESSGASLAAGLSLLLRDLQAPAPSYQVLAYPVTDKLGRWPSYDEYGSGYVLDRDLMEWFLEQYVSPSSDRPDPYLYPLTADDLSGLPETLVVTAEFDPVRDEGVEFARRLDTAGVRVEHIHARDQMHGFLMLARAVARADDLLSVIASRLGARLGPS